MERVVDGRSGTELLHVRLAEDDRSGRTEAPHRRSLGRIVRHEHTARANGRVGPGHLDAVLHRDRHAVESRSQRAALDLTGDLSGPRQRSLRIDPN